MIRTGARESSSMKARRSGGRRVERDVGAARLEDGEQRDEHVGRAVGAEADEDLGADAEPAEAVGERLARALSWR